MEGTSTTRRYYVRVAAFSFIPTYGTLGNAALNVSRNLARVGQLLSVYYSASDRSITDHHPLESLAGDRAFDILDRAAADHLYGEPIV